MHSRPPLLRSLPALALLLLASGPSGAAEAGGAEAEVSQEVEVGGQPGEPVPDGRAIDWSDWTPSVFAGIAITAEGANSSLFARYVDITNPQAIPLVSRQEETLDGPEFPFGAELMAPPFLRLPGRPRLFVHGSYAMAREEKNQLAHDFVLQAGSQAQPPIGNAQMFGKFDSQIASGLGTAFHFELGDYPVLFKPSLNFYAQRLILDITSQAQVGSTEILSNSARIKKWFYYVGPMLEFDVEVGRQGPIGFQVFANTWIGYLVSDDDIRKEGLFANPSLNEVDLYTFEYDSLLVTGGAGLRLLWYGSD
jgi:hypothetical protein